MIKKASMIFLCAFVVGFFVASPAKAGNFGAQLCWSLEGFIDVLKLSVSTGGEQAELHGSLAAPGSYENTITGNAFAGTGGIVIGGFMSHDGSAFNFATGLSFHGILDGNLVGPVVFTGLDQPFSAAANLIPMACPPGPAAAEGTGQALGE